jgi:hypothetical protein
MKYTWAPSFVLARAYLDQLARSNGLTTETIAAARTTLANAEKRNGAERKTALTGLASQLKTAAAGSKDGAKVTVLAATVTELSNMDR